MLRRLAVDLDELSGILEGNPVYGGGRVDRHSGEVWHASAVEYARETGEEDDTVTEDPDRWLRIHSEGSCDSYRDMETFIATVADPSRARRLDAALGGRGPFRRFKNTLAAWPDELERWYGWSEERRMGRARKRLADAGHTPG
jgi:hypothetical protein